MDADLNGVFLGEERSKEIDLQPDICSFRSGSQQGRYAYDLQPSLDVQAVSKDLIERWKMEISLPCIPLSYSSGTFCSRVRNTRALFAACLRRARHHRKLPAAIHFRKIARTEKSMQSFECPRRSKELKYVPILGLPCIRLVNPNLLR